MPLTVFRTLCLFALLVSMPVAARAAADDARVVAASAAAVQQLWSAELLVSDAATPPPDSAAWETVQLPDRWRDPARYETGVIGWYRFDVPAELAPRAGERSAAYLWRYNMVVEVWFNGELVAETGSFEEPVTRNWNRPLLVDLPRSAWRGAGNRLDVRLRAYPHYGALAPVFVGSRDELEGAWRLRSFLQNDLSLALLVLTLTLAGVGFALWIPRRDETVYLFFALASLAYSVFSVNLVIREVPMPGETWWWIANSAIDWWAVLLALFGFRLVGLVRPRLERTLLLYGVTATTVQAAVDLPTFAIVCNLFHLVSLLICGALLGLVVVHWYRTRRGDLMAFALGIAWIFLLACHDLLMNAVVKVEMWRYGFFLLNLGAPLVFLAMAWHLIRRYADALATAEIANASLGARIDEARRALAASYAEQRQLELAKAAGDERERIYRDLHDDVGARLLSLVYAAPDDASKSLARDALRQLRELVAHSGAEPSLASELAERLGSETEERARAAGLDCRRETMVGVDLELNAVEAWHVTRIVREAVSNALRHGEANALRFRFVVAADGAIDVRVADDGRGLDDASRAGRGLRNMRERARELGGTLEVTEGDAGGCEVRLRMGAQDVAAAAGG